MSFIEIYSDVVLLVLSVLIIFLRCLVEEIECFSNTLKNYTMSDVYV